MDVIPTWALFFMGPAPCWSLAISIRTFFGTALLAVAYEYSYVLCPALLAVGDKYWYIWVPGPLGRWPLPFVLPGPLGRWRVFVPDSLVVDCYVFLTCLRR